jgi:hypothetical protein
LLVAASYKGQIKAAVERLKELGMSAKQRGKRAAIDPQHVATTAPAPAPAKRAAAAQPPRKRHAPLDDDNDDDDLQVTGHTGSVALSDFPHSREHCHNFNFAPGVEHQHCENCFCLVCDIAASSCTEWSVHCKAVYESAKWQELRQLRRKAVRSCTDLGTDTVSHSPATRGPTLWSYDRMMEAVQQVYPLEEPEPAGLATEVQLRPYQRQSLSFVLQMERSTSKALAGCRTFTGSPLSLIRGGWVADEVGMGKTAVAIAVVLANPSKAPRPSDKAWYQHEYAKYKTTLVVVPRLTSRWNLSADPPPVCTFPCTFDCTFPCIASAAAKAHRCLFARAFAAC